MDTLRIDDGRFSAAERHNRIDRRKERAVTPVESVGSALVDNAVVDDEYWDDQFFLNGFSDPVTAVVTDDRGNVYVGGGFEYIGSLEVNGIAKWNGTSWSAVGSGLGRVSALAMGPEGMLYAAFETTEGARVTRWDGRQWSSLGESNLYAVSDIAVDARGAVYVASRGGWYIDGVKQYVVRWNGANWSAPGGGTNGPVRALTIDERGDLLVGGEFTTAGDMQVSNVARWDGTNWSSVGVGLNVPVQRFATSSDGTVYAGVSAGAEASGAEPRIYRWRLDEWAPVGSGFEGVIEALAVRADETLVAAIWDVYPGCDYCTNDAYVAAWDGTTWAKLGGETWARALAIAPNGTLLAGASALASDYGLGTGVLAEWKDAEWSHIPPNERGYGLDGTNPFTLAVFVMAVDRSGIVYVGGRFTEAGGVAVNNVAKLDGLKWSALGEGLDGHVDALVVDERGTVYAAVRDADSEYVAAWDGATWRSLGNTTGRNGGAVSALAVDDDDGTLYVGGEFDGMGGVAASNVARWDGSGWKEVGSGLSGRVYDLLIDQEGTLFAAGLAVYEGADTVAVARWNGVTWSGVGSGTWLISSIVAGTDGDLFGAGNFTTGVDGVRRWDGTRWTTIGGTHARELAMDDRGMLYAAGKFSQIGDTLATNVAMWDGERWAPLASGAGNQEHGSGSTRVHALAVDTVGGRHLYVGGDFVRAGGNWSSLIARWDLDSRGTAVSEPEVAPLGISISAPYPNPARTATTLTYTLPRGGPVRLSVYDMLGREVVVLVDDQQQPATYTVRVPADRLAAGVYVVRLSAAGGSVSRRVIVVR